MYMYMCNGSIPFLPNNWLNKSCYNIIHCTSAAIPRISRKCSMDGKSVFCNTWLPALTLLIVTCIMYNSTACTCTCTSYYYYSGVHSISTNTCTCTVYNVSVIQCVPHISAVQITSQVGKYSSYTHRKFIAWKLNWPLFTIPVRTKIKTKFCHTEIPNYGTVYNVRVHCTCRLTILTV